MKNNYLEQVILYLLVACAALVLATLVRISAVSLGVDSFTAFIIFIVVLGIEAVVYLSLHVILQSLMLPWIGRWLFKIPYFRNKIEKRQIPVIENINILEQISLEDIRNEQQQNIAKEQEKKLNIALNYTQKSFALYLSGEHLEVLRRNVYVYAGKLEMKELKPVKVTKLAVIDLRHFGWNIWNFFKPRNQMDIAYFLKNVFPDIFKDVTEDSIKSHLKDDEIKGIIKIQESLSEQ